MADNGYIDKKRQAAVAQAKVLLLTPKTTLAETNPLLGADPLPTATQVDTWQVSRKTAIEPIFDLFSKLLSITGAHKPYRCEVYLMLPLFGVGHPAIATRDVDEPPLGRTYAKHHTH